MTSKAALAAIAIAGCLVGTSMARGEERTVDAYAPWEGRGQIYPVGVNQAMFVGAFTGAMFVERDKKIVSAGNILCPGVIELNLRDGSQSGNGKCTLSNSDGERIFAEWKCAGTHFIGCDGKFKLVAGTGEYEGISGEGDFVVRSGLHVIAASLSGSVVERAASGLAIWRNFRFKVPDR